MHGVSDFFVHLVQHYGYAGLLIAMSLVNIGAPGSEIILPAAGAAAAKGLLSSVWLAIAVAVAGELVGQSVGYAVGRFGGRPFLDRYGRYIHVTSNELQRVHNFFDRYGKFSIFLCRLIPMVRGIVGIPAGIAEMPLAPFLLWTCLGSTIFCGALILLGHALGAHAHEVIATTRKYLLLIVAIAVVALAGYFIIRARRAKADEPA